MEPPLPVKLLHRYAVRGILSVCLIASFSYVPVQAKAPEIVQLPPSIEFNISTLQYERSLINPLQVESVYEIEQKTKTVAVVTVPKKTPQRRNLTVNSGINYSGDVEVLAGPSSAYNNCYAWVASQRSIPRTRNGNAGTTPTNSQTPVVGAVAIMAGHVGLVESIQGDMIVVKDANYRHSYLTRHTVPRSAIKGYFN